MKDDELEIQEQISKRLTIIENKIIEHNKKFEVLIEEMKKRRNVKRQMSYKLKFSTLYKKFLKRLDFLPKIGYNINEHKRTQKSRSQSYSLIM